MSTKKAPTKAEQSKLDAEKVEAEQAEQAKLDAEKAEAEQAEQAKLDAEKAEAEAKAEEEAQVKANADAKAEAEKAKPAVLKPWNGEPLMPAPESEMVETAKSAPIKPAKTSGKTYHAQWTLHHNNKRYAAGDTLTLSDNEAAPLIKNGVLVAAK